MLFPDAGYTKLDLVRYYLAVADGALRGAGGRPNVLVRYPNGIGEEFFYQKRAPESRPEWIEVVALKFPSGRTAEEVVPRDAAALAWMANLACLELHPHPVRAEELDHPDELRVDLDPVPGVEWRQVQDVAKRRSRDARRSRADRLAEDVGIARAFTSTSASISDGPSTRCAAPRVALAREVERRAPAIATSKWWKEERHGVFIDYNQNAKDRTVCSAFSVRPRPDARVSTPLTWDEIDRVRSRRLHDEDHAGVVQGERRSPCRRSIVIRARSRRCSNCRRSRRRKGRAMRRGRRNTRRARRADARAAVARPPSPRLQAPSRKPASGRRVSKHPLIVDRAFDEEGRSARVARGVEGRNIRRSSSTLQPADILIDSMRGRSSTWWRDAHQSAARAGGTAAGAAEAAADPESLGGRYSGADRGVSRDAPKTAASS